MSRVLLITKLSFILIGFALLGGVFGQDNYCCTRDGIEYKCQPGTSCCACNECCSTSEFCWDSQEICLQYSLVIVSPITLLIFMGACFWNYKTKREIIKDEVSYRILEQKGEELVNCENRNEKQRLQVLNEEGLVNRNSTKQNQVEDSKLYIVEMENDQNQQLEQPLLDYFKQKEEEETVLSNNSKNINIPN